MLKKALFIFTLASCLSIVAHAESCPSINDLKQNSLHGWSMYDIDNGTPIQNPKAVRDYEYNARAFGLAEWALESPEGEAHCYYFHQNPNLGYGAAYLAKTNLVDNGSSVWLNGKKQQCTQKDDNCQCTAGNEACGFVTAG